ncbi:MAG: SMP-30/gluconolactonase/LRE family protein [Planctomycetota bacterium]|nr:SMP-30/gluconolactonase/LRE family protein [Planctomycetota bacterium]
MTAPIVCIARDISGAEGPCIDHQGRIFMVGPDEGRLLEVSPDGKTRDLVKYDGIPAGLQLDPNNDFWVADMKRGLLRVTHEGKLIEEVVTFEGKPIRGCNDCIFDTQGHLYFTAPGGSSKAKAVGEVFCRRADGKVTRLDAGYHFCNGLVVTADDRTLIVAETYTKKLWAFDIVEPGVVRNKRHWATLPGDHEGGPDGMDLDSRGYLLATNWGGQAIEIFNPAGTHVGQIKTPFACPSNVHFMGPGSRELLITEHNTHGIWKTTHTCEGQRQYGWK